MAYFDKKFIKFFKDLSKNNDRDWFKANKKTYDEFVKGAFDVFIEDVIAAVRKKDPEVNIEPKDAVFRIYRDVRFSKNKDPYKTHAAAVVSKFGRRDTSVPGIYIMMNHEKMMVGGGIYAPDKEEIYRVRDAIAQDPKAFNKIVNVKSFKDTFGELQGEKNKIIPKEFKEVAEEAPLIFNKQWFYMADLPAEAILEDDLVKVVLNIDKKAKPIRDFLFNATKD